MSMKRMTVWMMALALTGSSGVACMAQEDPAILVETEASTEETLDEGTADDGSEDDNSAQEESSEEEFGFLYPEDIVETKAGFYRESSSDYTPDAYSVLFFDGNESVAYMSVEDLNEITLLSEEDSDPDFNLTGEYERDGDICLSYSLERENGASVWFDFTDGTFWHDDINRFSIASSAVSGGDYLAAYNGLYDDDGNLLVNEDGVPYADRITRVLNHYNFERKGYHLGLDLVDHHLKFYYYNDSLYMPVTTYSDFILGCGFYSLVYMGSDLFLMLSSGPDANYENEDGDTLMDIYMDSVEAGDRPQELAEFNYWELTALLDMYYGLKEEHKINSSFDEYFEAIGLKEDLMSTDSQVYAEALSELMTGYFGDLHSDIDMCSPYVDSAFQSSGDNSSASIYDYVRIKQYYTAIRDKSGISEHIPDIDENGNDLGRSQVVNAYQEVGNTAYITFDHFEEDPGFELYADAANGNLEDYIDSDTFALIAYAQSQISREDSPVENIVLDLSLNGGGVLDTAVYVVAWLLGECDVSTTNPMSDTQYTVGYQADTNLDGYITKDDWIDLTTHRIYCLTSMASFSCGNYVPALLKSSNIVTTLGQTSGGGACLVKNSITADGTVIQYSGPAKLCTVRNGSYYGVDLGVAPDFTISDPAYLYDREWLTDYINSLPC